MHTVKSYGTDAPVSEIGQWLATGLTFALALGVIVFVARTCLRERIVWPALVTLSGALTCLMEPLFDRLYGLWFRREGQWHLYTTFGSAQPIWVPAAYIAFYGGATVIIARTLARSPSMKTIAAIYASIAVMSLAAEITYVSVLKVYEYQGDQPFVVLGYPIFLGFTNAMCTVVSGIVVYRLVPLLRGWSQLYLVMLVPSAFGMSMIGGGIIYLSVRHASAEAPMIVLSLAALTLVGAIAATIAMLGHHLVEGQPPRHPSLRTEPDTHSAMGRSLVSR